MRKTIVPCSRVIQTLDIDLCLFPYRFKKTGKRNNLFFLQITCSFFFETLKSVSHCWMPEKTILLHIILLSKHKNVSQIISNRLRKKNTVCHIRQDNYNYFLLHNKIVKQRIVDDASCRDVTLRLKIRF